MTILLQMLYEWIHAERCAKCPFNSVPKSSLPSKTRSSAHSPSFPSFHLRHNSFSNPSLALPTSQLILQPFRCFTYVTAHSPTLLSLLLRDRIFTYVTWRAAQGSLEHLNVPVFKTWTLNYGLYYIYLGTNAYVEHISSLMNMF